MFKASKTVRAMATVGGERWTLGPALFSLRCSCGVRVERGQQHTINHTRRQVVCLACAPADVADALGRAA